MKKLAILLTLVLLLTGCGKEQPVQTDSAGTETPNVPVLTEPTETTTAPTEPTTVPTEPTTAPTTAPTRPATEPTQLATQAPTKAPTQPATQAPTKAPTQPATQAPTKAPTQPATSSRPTSSATCRDSGSSAIWVNPAASINEETDPKRTKYIKTNTNRENMFEDFGYRTIIGGYGGLTMYTGHTYGMPFMHEGDIAELRWYSSDPSIATVNDVGFVTPLREGEIKIGFFDKDGNEFRRTVRVIEEKQYTEAELEQEAKKVAKAIAKYVTEDLPCNSDLERIAAAANIVYGYVDNGNTIPSYEIDAQGNTKCTVVGYNKPFGTLVTGYSTCAGNTRAMGLVLEYMGFEWYHVNANQWDHQWCVVYDVDGKTAFADAAWAGVAGYGDRQTDQCYVYTSNGLEVFNGMQPF